MWIDTTPFPPCKPNLKKKSALPPCFGRGRRREGAGSAPRGRAGNSAIGVPRRLQELKDSAPFCGGKKGLGRFFFFFSIFYSLDKQTSRSRCFRACPRGSIAGLGEGRGLCSIPNENSNSLHPPRSIPGGLSGSEGSPGPREAPPGRALLSPAQENAWSRQGPPQRGARRLPRGPRAPGSSPARPGIGFLHKSVAG